MALTGLTGLLAVGCGGAADLGFRGTLPAERRHKVEAVLAPGKSLTFPADKPLNVHDKLSAQTPGPDGQARGEARADETGQANCTASADSGGTAWGRFQIGHCLDNRSGAALLADVEFAVEYEVAADCKAPSATGGGATPARGADPLEAVVTLRVIVKDSNEKVLRTMALAEVNNDLGRVGKKGVETPRFTFEMQPDLAYTLALVGESRVATGAGAGATATATIKKLSISVTGRS